MGQDFLSDMGYGMDNCGKLPECINTKAHVHQQHTYQFLNNWLL